MTHDELLANINKEIDEKAFIPERYYPVRYLLSLRAVVELHRPVYSEHYAARNLEGCSICNDWWPCLTVEAIQKEMK